jgi:threonine dehydrogenase-like Zn-dependent dehydrogenase
VSVTDGGEALAYWSIGPGKGELRPCRVMPPGAGEALVRTRWSGISRGTEALVAMGRVPQSQAAAMRAPFQEGEFPFPVKYGYCSVGVVEAGEEDLVGRYVFCLHPHQTAYVVPANAVTPLPAGLPPDRAILAANMETALNAVWDGGPHAGERIHVIGGGVVGCLVAYLCGHIPGAEVTLADPLPEREAIAGALGVTFALPEALAVEADLVFHASGHPGGLRTALATAGLEARIVELSWYGSAEVAVSLGEAFHSRRLTLQGSQVGQVAAMMRPRWSHARRLAKALDLLCDPVLDLLITGEIAFAELPTALPSLARDPGGALCVRIVYPN